MNVVKYPFEMERGKRLITLSMKLSDEELSEIEAIAKSEDRPLGYIGRELMFRGVAQYQKDGKLRDTGLTPTQFTNADKGGKLAA